MVKVDVRVVKTDQQGCANFLLYLEDECLDDQAFSPGGIHNSPSGMHGPDSTFLVVWANHKEVDAR